MIESAVWWCEGLSPHHLPRFTPVSRTAIRLIDVVFPIFYYFLFFPRTMRNFLKIFQHRSSERLSSFPLCLSVSYYPEGCIHGAVPGGVWSLIIDHAPLVERVARCRNCTTFQSSMIILSYIYNIHICLYIHTPFPLIFGEPDTLFLTRKQKITFF